MPKNKQVDLVVGDKEVKIPPKAHYFRVEVPSELKEHNWDWKHTLDAINDSRGRCNFIHRKGSKVVVEAIFKEQEDLDAFRDWLVRWQKAMES